MSTNTPKDTTTSGLAHGAKIVVSTRYDNGLVEWAMRVTGCSKSELVKRGLDRIIKELLEAA